MGVFNLICTFSIGIHFEFGVGGGRPLDAEWADHAPCDFAKVAVLRAIAIVGNFLEICVLNVLNII
jgi:hypothetical protein